MKIVIITGPSGSGKTSALHAMEDLGFYAVDNLPLPLISRFVELLDKVQEASQAALVIDARSGTLIKDHDPIFAELKEQGHDLEVLFLDAPENVLVRRFSQTRRKHPLAPDNVHNGIQAEHKLLSSLKDAAKTVVDTGSLTVHQLKSIVWDRYRRPDDEMAVALKSFGFKNGIPPEADIVLDVRFLPNPYFEPELTELSGIDSRVAAYVLEHEEASVFLDKTADLLGYLIPLYKKEGKTYLTVAVGCTGGRHRSVAVIEALNKRLAQKSVKASVRHRDVART